VRLDTREISISIAQERQNEPLVNCEPEVIGFRPIDGDRRITYETPPDTGDLSEMRFNSSDPSRFFFFLLFLFFLSSSS